MNVRVCNLFDMKTCSRIGLCSASQAGLCWRVLRYVLYLHKKVGCSCCAGANFIMRPKKRNKAGSESDECESDRKICLKTTDKNWWVWQPAKLTQRKEMNEREQTRTDYRLEERWMMHIVSFFKFCFKKVEKLAWNISVVLFLCAYEFINWSSCREVFNYNWWQFGWLVTKFLFASLCGCASLSVPIRQISLSLFLTHEK